MPRSGIVFSPGTVTIHRFMRTTTTFIIAALAFLSSACNSEKDSVKQAQEQNQNSAIDKDISEFMTEAADARMMDIEMGKLAMEKGTTAAIKQYGQLMITEQTKMLQDLRVLAASKNIILPNKLSDKSAGTLEDLKEKSGVEFDDEFMERMKKDHKDDVDEFDDATDFADRDVKKFAETYVPVVESHLDKIREIEKKQ